MADIELVIKIPNDIYHRVVVSPRCATSLDAFRDRDIFVKALQTSTPLPKVHGDLKDMNDIYEALEGWNDDTSWIVDAIDSQTPTIIKAENKELRRGCTEK